jgi:hypothetical protein
MSEILREAMLRQHTSLISCIYRNAGRFGLDLMDDANGIDLAVLCVRHRLISINDVMLYIPTVKLGDTRWMDVLMKAANAMDNPLVSPLARPIFNAILNCADVYGDGIQLEGDIPGKVEYYAGDLAEKQRVQQYNKRQQIVLARVVLEPILLPELVSLVCSFYLIEKK